MATCRHHGYDHDMAGDHCKLVIRKTPAMGQTGAAQLPVVPRGIPLLATPTVSHMANSPSVSHADVTKPTYKYRDPEARRAYQRELMTARRRKAGMKKRIYNAKD